MSGLLGYLKSFRGDGIEDRNRPNQNVGMAFLAAAVVVALVGFKWMSGGGGTVSANGDGWTLGGAYGSYQSAGPTTIPASPPAEAVRIGADSGGAAADGTVTVTSMLPDGTPIIISGPGSTGSTGSTGSAGSTGSTGSTGTTNPGETTTSFTTVESTEPPPTDPTTTEDTTTTTEETTTTTDTTTTDGGGGGVQPEALVSGLAEVLGGVGAILAS